MMAKCLFLSLHLLLSISLAFSSHYAAAGMNSSTSFVLPLWNKTIPNSKPSDEHEIVTTEKIIKISKVQIPTIEVFLPEKDKATGQAVVIFPGGGYQMLAYDWEGQDIAKWLNTQGIAGIVVKYRLPSSESIQVRHTAPLMDAKQAMQLTRFNAKKWNINAENIGIMGFSAGGHLASTLGTKFDSPAPKKLEIEKQNNPIKQTITSTSNRPDFMVLMYPVISMQLEDTHKGSRNSLLGKAPTAELVNYYSNHLHVKKNTPPTFILHASNDKAVPVENTLKMFNALKASDVPVEMHIFPKGGHGFALSATYQPIAHWPNLLNVWLAALQ